MSAPFGGARFDLGSAELFVEAIAGSASPATFQTLDDKGTGTKALRKVFHGTIKELGQELIDLNSNGAGIYLMANAGDLRGRKALNVTAIRVAFVDLDGTPLCVIDDAPISPHIIVETSPGRWQACWLISGCPLSQFSLVQKALAKRFKGDPSVSDLSRVMRIPGFFHNKSTPVPVRLHKLTQDPSIPYPDFIRAFSIQPGASENTKMEEGQKRTEEDRMTFSTLPSSSVCATQPKAPGQRNEKLFEYARRMKARHPNATPSERREMVREWYAKALANIRTQEIAVSFEDFERAWPQIKKLYGVELESALRRKEQPPESVERLGYGSAATRMVEIMFRLHLHQQHCHSGGPIIMGARKAGELLGIDKNDANKILKCLQRDGVLELVEKGEMRRASRWRWSWPEC